jgi:hypothetical protein
MDKSISGSTCEMKINNYFLLIFWSVCVVCGCSQKKDLDNVSVYVQKNGTPDLVAKSIKIEKKQKGLNVVIVEHPQPKFSKTNSIESLASTMLLFAMSSELKWSIENYYNEKSQPTNMVDGMYYPTRSLFGEKVIIVQVDAAGKVASIGTRKIDAVSIRDRALPE